MDPIFLGLTGAVIVAMAAATAALLYAISLRAKIVGLETEICALELERAELETVKPDQYHLLEVEWDRLRARWHRHGEPFALALMDLSDALRPETELPPAVLARVMAAVDRARRTEDCWFQLDGRTTAVLLAGSTAEGGWAFVERLRAVLGNEPFAYPGGAAYVDARVGIAEWSVQLASLAELVSAAYHARKDFSGQIMEQRGDFLPGPRGAAAS